MGAEVEIKFNVGEAIDKIDTTIKERMLMAVNEVRNTALEVLSGNRHGRTYRVPGTQRTYTASAPGEPPAQATGELRQSVKTELTGDARQTVGIVGSDKKYAPMLEYGTRHIRPRPWLRISFEKSLDKIKEILSRKWFQ